MRRSDTESRQGRKNDWSWGLCRPWRDSPRQQPGSPALKGWAIVFRPVGLTGTGPEANFCRYERPTIPGWIWARG